MTTGYLLISQPDGQSYFQLDYIEAKRLFLEGQISPEQYIWSIAHNQWVAAKDFFQEAKKQSVRLVTEYAKKTQTAALKTAEATKRIVVNATTPRKGLPAVAQGALPQRQQTRPAAATNLAAVTAEPKLAPFLILTGLMAAGIGISVASQMAPTQMFNATVNSMRPVILVLGGLLTLSSLIPFFIVLKRIFKK